jgi:molybdate transport system ATP-binding protein
VVANVVTGLDAHLALAFGDGFSLDVSLEIPPGRTVALLGPNGAGKSTTVAVLAGLAAIDEGQVVLDDRVLTDPAAGVFVPPEERHIGVVFQDYLLFPHMTVAQNVAFGAHHESAAEWIERLDLGEVADRKPGGLSGGQAQRVALARALASRPSMLLLDEPLAALDVTTRTRLRRTLAQHLGGFDGPRLLITHDPTEAFLLADEIYVIEQGSITQHGTADDIRLRPRTPYIADLAGSNLYAGTAHNGSVEVGGHVLHIADTHMSGEVLVTIPPRVASLHTRRPEGSPRNTWQTSVTLVEPLGDRTRLNIGPPLQLTVEITTDSARNLALVPGSPVWVSIKATEIGVEQG